MATVKNLTAGKIVLIERRAAGAPLGTPDVQRKLNPFGTAGDTGTIPDTYASSEEIQRLVTAGKLQIISFSQDSDSPVTQAEFNELLNYIVSTDAQVLFENGSPFSGTADGSTLTPVVVRVANGFGVTNPFNNTSMVTVSVSGSAVIVTSQPVTFTNGEATVQVKDSVVQMVTLTLSAPTPSGLAVVDTAQINFV